MESLRISEAYPRPYNMNERRTKDGQVRILRLPTPEDTHSGSERHSRGSVSDPSRSDAPPLDHHSSHGRSLKTSPTSSLHGSHSHRQRPLDSPPYGGCDSQKPSLPPIKTVLGDSLSSPPQTPTSYSACGQLSPQEPSVVAATYKPPSLYPNKKQRIDHILEAAPVIIPASAISSPGVPNLVSRPRPTHSSQPPPSSYPYPGHSDPYSTRRASIRYSSGRSSPNSGITPGSALSTDKPQHAFDRPVERRISVSKRPSCQVNVPEPPPNGRNIYHESPHRESRGPMDVYSPYGGSRPYDFPPAPPAAGNPIYQSTGGRDAVSPRQQSHMTPISGRPVLGAYGEGSAYRGGPYEMAVAEGQPFFMPSHYEYHHGKARKRSNLPKQSTEIMKTWFDQNITNPYPSEEQKALFSVATGISMTQVSNWFINHRRRCPELRDKRDKGRGPNGRDD